MEIQAVRLQLSLQAQRVQFAENGLKNLEKAFVVRQARRLGLIRVKRYELPDTKEFDKKKISCARLT
jgi:hypothetical protein